MRKFKFLYIFLIVTGNALSQNKVIDSLEQKLNTSDDKEKFFVLSDLAWEYCLLDANKSYNYAKEEVELAEKLKNDTLLSIAFNDFGERVIWAKQI